MLRVPVFVHWVCVGPEENYEPIHDCDLYVIIFGTETIILGSSTQLMWNLGIYTQYKPQKVK